LSPTIHNAGFAALGLDWVFTAFEVAAGRGESVVAAMRTLGLAGLNVTMPHKAAVARSVDRLTSLAESLEAVNCVFWDGDELVGDNTDGAGFVAALRQETGTDVDGLSCVVVGAGGAGRAVAHALGNADAAEVVVVNRSPVPARHAAALAGGGGRVGTVADVARADLVVNATPLGMKADDHESDGPTSPIDPMLLHNGQIVADLIYHPMTTPLLNAARAVGAEAVNGVGMLVHQAALAFERWTGCDAPTQVMADAVRQELARRSRVES
jgi:shikimate dehydrogenase